MERNRKRYKTHFPQLWFHFGYYYIGGFPHSGNCYRSLIPRYVGRTSGPNSVASNAGISSEMLSENIGLSEALSEESLDQPEFLESEEAPILETKSESGAS